MMLLSILPVRTSTRASPLSVPAQILPDGSSIMLYTLLLPSPFSVEYASHESFFFFSSYRQRNSPVPMPPAQTVPSDAHLTVSRSLYGNLPFAILNRWNFSPVIFFCLVSTKYKPSLVATQRMPFSSIERQWALFSNTPLIRNLSTCSGLPGSYRAMITPPSVEDRIVAIQMRPHLSSAMLYTSLMVISSFLPASLPATFPFSFPASLHSLPSTYKPPVRYPSQKWPLLSFKVE